jgi:hypothetical protein
MIQGGIGYPLSPKKYGGKTFSPPLTKLKMGSMEHVYIIKTCVEHNNHGCFQVNQGCIKVRVAQKVAREKSFFGGDFLGHNVTQFKGY